MKHRETPRKSDVDDRTQRQKFIDAAQEHGADGDEDTFRNALRKVATAPVSKSKKLSKPATRQSGSKKSQSS